MIVTTARIIQAARHSGLRLVGEIRHSPMLSGTEGQWHDFNIRVHVPIR